MKFLILLIIFTGIIISQDFQVSNTGTVVFGTHLASDSFGNFVIVWDDSRNIKIPFGGTGTEGDVYGQRYNKFGQPIGSNFRISDDSIETDISFASQFLVRVAMNTRGEFVVTWVDTRTTQSKSNPSPDFNIYAQRFDFGGNPVGANFLVNDYITSGLTNPDIFIRDDGSFVIVWVNTRKNKSLYIQPFDSIGSRIGTNKKLNLQGDQSRIAQFKFNTNNYIIVSDNAAQIYSFPSNEVSEPFNIAYGYTKDISIGNDDKIFIAQMENRITLEQILDSDIFLYQYDTLGNFYNKILVNDDLTDYWQTQPTISTDNSHIFVAWQDYRNGYQTGDGDCIDIYGQRFDFDLVSIGSNFKISHETNKSVQFNPSTVIKNNYILLAWLDGRSMEFYPNIYPPLPKIDVWATLQDFNNPIEGVPIKCSSFIPLPPSSFSFQCYPNPSNSNTTFTYSLPEDANVTLILYDILGKEVIILLSEFHVAGSYSKNFFINHLSSGIYLGKMVAKNSFGNLLSGIVKIILIK